MILLLSLGTTGAIILRRVDGRRQIAAVLTQRSRAGVCLGELIQAAVFVTCRASNNRTTP